MNAAAKVAQQVLGTEPTNLSHNYKEHPTEKMKACRWQAATKVSLDEVPAPMITDPKDVILHVTGSTICGSDLHIYHKDLLQQKSGMILGHEFCGIVADVGPEVTKFKKGDRVVSSFQIACGDCDMCRRGLTSMCDKTNDSTVQARLYGGKFGGIFGYTDFTGGYAGGQAEQVRVPFADINLLKIPDNLPDEKALYLSDIIPTSYHSVKSADVEEGKTVAIWGLGPIGLLAARWCQVFGASKIIGIDNVEARLDWAKNNLGIHTINFSKVSSVIDAIKEIVPIGVDCAIDAAAFRYTKGLLHTVQRAVGAETDSSEIVNEAIMSVRKFGTVSLIADYAGLTNQFNIGAVMEKGITLRGCGQTPVQRYWPELLEHLQAGRMDPTMILTHRVPLEEFVELYDTFDKKQDGMMKVFVQTKYSAPRAPGTPELTSLKH